ncbi:MAG: acetyl-CoA carboxylase, biotin carboxyl carrier protein [Acidocella sp. 20-57-95]|nr:MAG: acetyl-CoA carboxylase, biotin carboxyl carrier protein [Acidocella sp. 20-57-95]OYV60691.1 MAG: acetyl-CoA carboxylase, biotin carboxyl carrier protein [Acidocella sp. 21-58-7]HQT64057.1 acetyl-CoA carboxylase biotin carboxyl carrier protein [Acidocella sp.]HQU04451.1 acetyl-CoA carboxylase biotin carboxyl carrier protein [Acidocella sp.]
MTLSYKDVADIIKIIDSSSCDEVVVELADVKIVVRRGGGAGPVAAPVPPLTSAPSPAVIATPASSPPKAVPSAVPSSVSVPDGDDRIIVRAPMTGTFYRAPSPKDPPFVEVGSVVKAGDVLCSIEVMKLFTTITAEVSGRVVRIFPENAALVQFDQPLFAIEC